MDYTIHLTEKCNLNCRYCYEKNKKCVDIEFEQIKKLIDLELKNSSEYSIITFYGGEPLIKRELIKETIEYIKSKKTEKRFYYGITTNGTLIDEELLKYMKKNNFINVAYSFDGIKESHDLNRIMANGNGSYDKVLENSKKVLKYFKDAVAMCVLTKNNLKYLTDNVKYLTDLGFYYINILFDYTADWKDEDLEEIRRQYEAVAEIYKNRMLKGKKIYIPLFDEKIKTYVKYGFDCNKTCKLGMKSVNVGTDGNFYPCVQFVGNKEFIIGNVSNGIDVAARKRIIQKSGKEIDICKNCKINKRCKHTCACKNYSITKDVNELSPLVCETEKIVIEIVDKMAEELYASKCKVFIKKFYKNI